MREQKLTRHDVGREKFVDEVSFYYIYCFLNFDNNAVSCNCCFYPFGCLCVSVSHIPPHVK